MSVITKSLYALYPPVITFHCKLYPLSHITLTVLYGSNCWVKATFDAAMLFWSFYTWALIVMNFLSATFCSIADTVGELRVSALLSNRLYPLHRVRAILRRRVGTTSPVGSGRRRHDFETKDDPKSAAWLWFEVRQRYPLLLKPQVVLPEGGRGPPGDVMMVEAISGVMAA